MAGRPWCLPGCDRLDSHDGRDAGACMQDGEVLKPGPLDLVHRHPDIAVNVPLRDNSIRAYDAVPLWWPDGMFVWTPFRNVFARWHSGKTCYTLPSGNMVHVKPGCRC